MGRPRIPEFARSLLGTSAEDAWDGERILPHPEPTERSGFSAELTPSWAFVVQIRRGSGFTPETLIGRVEHIVSGRATTFSALGQLLAFIEQTLARLETADEE